MSDFGLIVKVTEGSNDGPPIEHATISGELVPAQTDVDGNAELDTVLVSVIANGFAPYIKQPYSRPSLQAPITVSLQRLAVSSTAHS